MSILDWLLALFIILVIVAGPLWFGYLAIWYMDNQ